MKNRAVFSFALAAFLAFLSTPAAATFCWKKTSTRGVGVIPTYCASGQENQSGLCYKNCSSGYGGAGPVCWGNCPQGMSDHGAGCTKQAPYGRGAGYPWKFGDGLNNNGMLSRCNKANKQGCEMDGAVAYPKCQSGYHKVGCCICSPNCPSGYADSGATCIKPTYGRGAGTIPTGCAPDRENSAGLCYVKCPSGMVGVAPVCWKGCTGAAPFNCAAGCAKDFAECQANINAQAMATAMFVINLAMLVDTGGFWVQIDTLAAGGKAVFTAALKGMVNGMRITNQSRENVAAAVKQAFPNASPIQQDYITRIVVGEDFDFKVIDQLGILTLAVAFTAPLCD